MPFRVHHNRLVAGEAERALLRERRGRDLPRYRVLAGPVGHVAVAERVLHRGAVPPVGGHGHRLGGAHGGDERARAGGERLAEELAVLGTAADERQQDQGQELVGHAGELSNARAVRPRV